jgi:hypothetical protein
VPHPAATDGCGWDSLPMDLFFHWIQSSHTLLNLNILAIPSIARPIYFSFELCALRLCGDLGRYLRPGFAKREGDHETAEMISAIVPHYLRSIVHCISQLHDLNPFSYQNHFSGVVLVPICAVSSMVHYFCIDGTRRPRKEEDG